MTDATLHAVRHARLLEVLSELKRDGAPTAADRAMLLGIDEDELARLVRGAPVSDALAEEIEFLMGQPSGWMDTPREMEPARLLPVRYDAAPFPCMVSFWARGT